VFAEIAFAGKSNVGKSSLINTLVGRRKLARTSGTPGRTRELVLFRVTLRDGSFDCIDLPGYGYAKVSKHERRAWGPMIESFLAHRVGLRCVVVIVDIRRGLDDDDAQLIEHLHGLGLGIALVATKIDKLSRSRVEPALRALAKQVGGRVLGFSAQSGDGKDALLRALLEHAGLGSGHATPPAEGSVPGG